MSSEDGFRGGGEVYTLLAVAAAAAEAGDLEASARALKQVREVPVDDPLLLDHYLAGFEARLGAAGQGNLYLRKEEVAQIDLFAVLGRHLPLLRAARLADDNLLPFLRGRSSATVLGLGIGKGRQECDLLARAPHVRSLTVIGVDVAGESLDTAAAALRSAGDRAGTAVTFHPVRAATEDLDATVWELVRRSPRPLLVTASFALHHMRDVAGEDTRAALFRRLRSLEPDAVALCEADSDHHNVPLSARFANSWHHYGTLFRAIDSTGATAPEKSAMKQFFGREIQNVIGAADEDRYERHEPLRVWAERFTAHGFRLVEPSSPHPDTQAGFTALARASYIELAYRNIPLAGVLTAVPDRFFKTRF
ncbi:GRAS family protein [Streptomyces sp. NPDC048603]|uniref:GRAS family protein n=1 Tax=Streptomyces sp. NPDC048603 TaxID=3365577 RepID=UPI003715D66B